MVGAILAWSIACVSLSRPSKRPSSLAGATGEAAGGGASLASSPDAAGTKAPLSADKPAAAVQAVSPRSWAASMSACNGMAMKNWLVKMMEMVAKN